jgi:hypothetical protein
LQFFLSAVIKERKHERHFSYWKYRPNPGRTR